MKEVLQLQVVTVGFLLAAFMAILALQLGAAFGASCFSLLLKSGLFYQLAISQVAAPRAQFIKAADYYPAFRSCMQSGRRCIGSSDHWKKNTSTAAYLSNPNILLDDIR